MAFLVFLSGIFLTFLVFGPALGETFDRRDADKNKTDWDAEYPLLPNTSEEDHFHENVIYQLYTEKNSVLRVAYDKLEIIITQLGRVKIGTTYKADEDLDTSHFVFLNLDSNSNDSKPTMAAIFLHDETPGYVRLLVEHNSFLATFTRTAFNPLICIHRKHHYPCPIESYFHVYPEKIKCTDPPEFFLDFGHNGENLRRLHVENDGDRLAYLAPKSEEATKFHLRPVIRRAVSVLQNLTYLSSPADIIAEARDVALGINEVVTNHGEATYVHEISHNTETSHSSLVETFVTIAGGISVTHEVGVGFEIPEVGSASVTASLGVSFEASSTKTSTATHGASESLKMAQKITVGPGTRLQTTAFFKVVPQTTIEFIAISKVYIYWEVYNKVSNTVVPRLAPLGVAVVEVARNVKGWDIIGTDGDAVVVKFRGAMTAEHGIATVFSAEPI